MRTPEQHAVAAAIIRLMGGVIYQEGDEDTWLALIHQGPAIRDHFATIGVDVVVNETEGFAYLRTRPEVDGEEPLPRIVKRRALTYNVSLLLVLLRKRMVEFEAMGGEGQLVVTRDQVIDMLRLFLSESTNEARVIDQIDRTLRNAEGLGFLRQLRGHSDHWEVRRVLKAYVDAETLSDFSGKLAEYAGAVRGGDE